MKTPGPPQKQFEAASVPKATTIIYMVALLIIASISITSHMMTNKIVLAQERTALLVNTAGRQRMLSQRITRIAEESADGSLGHTEASAQIRRLADRMEGSQRQLIYGDVTQGLPPTTLPELRAIYFGPKVHLEKQVEEFLGHSRAFAAEPAPKLGDAHLQAMVSAAAAPLLDGLDAAVGTYQAASEHDIRHLNHVMNTLTGLMLLVLVLEALLIYRPLFNRLTGAISLLIKTSATDFLTGVLNRRAFMLQAERELARSAHDGETLCMMILDLDHFKRINDTYGHPGGDVVLQHFAAIAQKVLRPGDLLGRLGGEEFCLILPGMNLSGGMQVAERIRETVALSAVAVEQATVFVTVSIGMLCVTGGTLPENMGRADKLLYQAKSNGRNRIESAFGEQLEAGLNAVHAQAG